MGRVWRVLKREWMLECSLSSHGSFLEEVRF